MDEVGAPPTAKPRRRFRILRWVGIALGALALVLIVNAIVVSRETKPASADAGRIVELPGGDIQVREDGPRNAPAIVLLHCYTCSMKWWDPVVPALAEAIEAGGIFHDVGGTDKPSALREMVRHLRAPEDLDREFLLHVLLAREQLQSTGIGGGVAIPHVRNPILLHIARPLITLCFLARPVPFEALDGRPVHALFSLMCPTVRVHLALLARLSFALHDECFTRVIAEQGAALDVLAAARRVDQTLEQKHDPRGRTR